MSVGKLQFRSPAPDTTQKIAASLASACIPGDCILLYGDLGAGKTTFARGFIGALCATPEEIVSPTFTLVQTYPTRAGGSIWHFDLYRLKKPEEIVEIGLDEALATGITLIEWPQLIEKNLPANALKVQLAYGQGDERMMTLSGDAAFWQARLAQLKTMEPLQ